jgi:hypothetical protein
MQFSAKPFGYPFAKLKELQADTQANAFACTFNFSQPHRNSDNILLNRQFFTVYLTR